MPHYCAECGVEIWACPPSRRCSACEVTQANPARFTPSEEGKADGSAERIRELEAQRDALITALWELVAKLDAVHADPLYQSVWTLFMVHGGDYSNGPKYNTELELARAALTQAGAEPVA